MKWRFLKNIAVLTVLVTVNALIWGTSSMASILTSASLTLSNQQTSTETNQVLEFVTPTGVDASTDTIILKYESGFSLSSLSTPGDFDLAVDDDSACDGPFSDKTLAASAAAGTWGVGVSGQLITFTAPTDAAGGEVAAGRCLQIQVGTSAAGGTNNMVNPASAGSYDVDVYGTFGDQAMYAVGIQDNTPFIVGATVSVTTGGGNPPPPAPGDTTAPLITDIVVSNIATTSATVSWITNEASETELLYGLDTSYTEPSMVDTAFRTEHTRNITGLSDSTLYHFQIFASDLSSNSATSSDLTFSTLDVTPPLITNLQVTNITEATATVTWETNEASDSSVIGSFGTITDVAMVTDHSVDLTGLVPGTLYPIDVYSSDSSANEATAATSFSTLIDLPPTNVINFTAVAGDEEVGLYWANPPDSDFANVSLRYQLGTYPSSITAGTEIYSGSGESSIHAGLTNGTEYFYTIFAIDFGGNVSSGASTSAVPFATAPPVTPPTPPTPPTSTPTGLAISNLRVTNITQNSATVTWTTTTPANSSATVSTIGTFLNAPLVVDHSLSITGLASDTAYVLTAESTDATSSTASATISFSTLTEGIVPTEPEEEVVGGGDEEEVIEPPTEPEEPVVAPTPSVLIKRAEVEFLVARDAIQITPNLNNELKVLANRGLTVGVNFANAPADITSVQLMVGNSIFIMNPDTSIVAGSNGDMVTVGDNHIYSARFITPQASTPMSVRVNYITGEAQIIDYNLEVQPEGIVRDKSNGTALNGATIMAFIQNGKASLWNAVPYMQINPLVLDESSSYAWYVPNGTYLLEVQRSGYNTLRTAKISIDDNILNVPVDLVAILPPLLEEIKSVRDVIPALTRRLVNSIEVARQSPVLQESADVAAPIVAVTAVSTVTLLATSFNAIRFLQYIFTAPLLLYRRRRRKRWGVVYDSLRKLPVDLAIVRLIDVATNRPVSSQVTDKEGRFLFIVDPGVYKIEVRKEGFTIPTDHLRDIRVDGDYLDLYHGESIEVNEESAAISVNIPADPIGREMTISRKSKMLIWLRRVMYGLSSVGAVVAVFVAIIDPSPWTISLAVCQILVLGLFVKLAIPKKPSSWGIVYNEKTRRPLSKAIVRIFEPKYNKLLETKITDSRGRYAFLVGPSEFYTTYEKEGFQKVEVRPIDRTDTKSASYVSMDIPLKKHNTQ